MKTVTRREFIRVSSGVLSGLLITPSTALSFQRIPPRIQCVTTSKEASFMGVSLIHEHILVDFIGADKYNPNRWYRDQVLKKVLPYLQEVKALGCQTIVDCTPAYLGRDPLLLKLVSQATGIQIITNTGYYGARQNKFLPAFAFTESADQLASRWVREFKRGIDDTGIKPGFIKIGVDPEPLSPIHQKLVQAAARTHLKTGMVIASHTGPAIPAFEQMEILRNEGVHPQAFIWVHAQSEPEKEKYIEAVNEGAWVSLDGVSDQNVDEYLQLLLFMKEKQLWHRTLVSHDAGWYHPGEPKGGEFRPFTTIHKKLLPLMVQNGFTQVEIDQLLKVNPANAFAIRVKPLVK
ncbi:phosphotriesterase [Cytophagaceae bacterium DM2B3-1]|uniref:Phosphotriesterase n=1 Tax=Xanthocytophaga flava TaxID=3048013 RepID=A0ABT7CGU7_9BACT|nr:phosphotriesterase [Xanthocytophaga flavus]MDJ1472251.1 phosphotriesterase [Xanthocytophaga flavus]MDJ1492262.1 phosphotriesterase [Xanthocytophaga flavus]